MNLPGSILYSDLLPDKDLEDWVRNGKHAQLHTDKDAEYWLKLWHDIEEGVLRITEIYGGWDGLPWPGNAPKKGAGWGCHNDCELWKADPEANPPTMFFNPEWCELAGEAGKQGLPEEMVNRYGRTTFAVT